MTKLLKYYLPAALWIIIIFILCTLPGKDIPTNSFLERIHFDKIVHFCMFGGVVLLLCLGIFFQKKRIPASAIFLIVLLSASYGLGIEFIQKYWAVQRSFDMYDVLADTLGAIAGVAAFKIILYFFLPRSK